ncbi:MAG: multiheme c-type cytochrome [Gemmataceae bacterium]
MSRRSVLPILAIAAVGVGSVALRAGPETGGQLPPPTGPMSSVKFVGASGCAAMGCHNAQGPLGSQGSEYSTWVHDPHIRAHEVLKESRSKQMIANLGAGWKPAHEETRCLACHTTPAGQCSDPRDPFADGVSCESCHGPAGNWKSTHYQPGWKALPLDHPEKLGYRDLRDLETRAENCAGCHVGDATKEVNHDLIAAGHPRLAFEFSAYQANYLRHWGRSQERYGDDFEARAWAVGQVATAKAALELVIARASKAAADATPWPEFSEYGCFACHHTIPAPEGIDNIPWRQNPRYAGLKVGALPFGTWYFPRLESVDAGGSLPSMSSNIVGKLTTAMAAPYPDPVVVKAEANTAHKALVGWLAAARNAKVAIPADQTLALFKKLTVDGLRSETRDGLTFYATTDWEDATQRYLALAANYQSLVEQRKLAVDGGMRDALLKARGTLAFPAGAKRLDNPKDFTPAKFQDALRQVTLP